MHDRRDIRTRRDDGGTIRGIAREIGADRNSVRRALAPDAALTYTRPSMADEYEPAVWDALADWPSMPVVQVAELIGWPGSRRALSDLVARVRPQVIERQLEDLTRPTVGTARAGSVSTGRIRVGELHTGRVHVRETQQSSRRTA